MVDAFSYGLKVVVVEDGVFDLLRWDLGAFVWEPDVETEVEVDGIVTARGRAVFVPVGEGHPAFGRG